MRDLNDFDRITIQLASSQRIREWSCGEVKKPETINYRTLRPERDGLFCERIFGTTKEWECYCGKYKSIRYKGVVCDRCGVEVTHFKIRRERMGHIELASPVSHIWYYKSVPSRIGLLLGISVSDLRSVLYFEKYVVTDPGDTDLKPLQLLTEEEYISYKEKYGVNFNAEIGADAVKNLLATIDLESEIEKLREKMEEKGQKSDPRLLKRLEILEDFHRSDNSPEWMILDVIPVIPPELRPMVQLDGGRFATSDLNDLYRRVINRNNRLKRLKDLKAPEIIIRNEKRMLQEAVDALFDNSRRKRAVKGPGNRPLKSLSDMLKGKQGRFRQNLLGKRVDYSGRSVIVVGPELRMHQCGLPKKMALELFKPFIMRGLVDKGYVYNIKSAKKWIEKEKQEVWGVLEEVIKEHPVLLNRAPTLHRLGIQAFEPVLVEGKAIKLHPLVCHAFNADFDGDQMAVHVPLSVEAQIECWLLMLSSKNLLNPANGQPIVAPTQDMVLGINQMTTEKRSGKGKGMLFSSFNEAEIAREFGVIDYQSLIKIRISRTEEEWIHKFPNVDWENNKFYTVETTLGRMIFNTCLPESFEYVNNPLDEKGLQRTVLRCFSEFGPSDTATMLDKIKKTGFKFSMIFGSTIGLDDVKIPTKKVSLIEKTDKEVEKIENQYRQGYITDDERYNKIVDVWSHTSDKISSEMMSELKTDKDGFNSLYMMANSGARGSRQQIRQLAGMRGLMAKPSGEIIELPIKSNFKEGLSVLEYFISTHGARKGLADTALKTADAGYLTRRLVDIAQDVVVTEENCGTINGLVLEAIREGEEEIERLADRIVGRYSAETIYHPKTHEPIVEQDEEINEIVAEQIEKAGIERVRIKSVLTCETEHGVCQKCYGRNLATGKTVEIGEAVGIIAAQSIGQPGTQLTMRTFHIGGAAAMQVEEATLKLNYSAIISGLPENYIDIEDGSKIVSRKSTLNLRRVISEYNVDDLKDITVKDGDRLLIGDVIGKSAEGTDVKSTNNCNVLIKDNIIYLIGPEATLNIKSGSRIVADIDEIVKRGQVIAEYDPYAEPIISDISGKLIFDDIIQGTTLKQSQVTDEIETGLGVIHEVKDGSLAPKVIIDSEEGQMQFPLPSGAILLVEEGQEIKAGETLAKIPRQQVKQKDITGGLPRVAELFEARKPKDACIIAEDDGIIIFGDRQKGKTVIYLETDFENDEGEPEKIKHVIPLNKRILVREGERVRAGMALCDGPVNPHDLLRVEGENKLQTYLVNEIQEVYRLQGVNINDKHVSIIIRQMLRKVEVTDVGDTDFIIGQQVDKFQFKKVNQDVADQGGKPASARPVLLGITKASLNIDSFISAASFQETTKVLTNAAIKGKTDQLRGLKENVIIGHLIPAGTGVKAFEKINARFSDPNAKAKKNLETDNLDEDFEEHDEEETVDTEETVES